MKVLLYGRLRDVIGREVDLDAPNGCSVAALRDRLVNEYPSAAAALRRSRSLVGDRFVDDEHVLDAGAMIELLPLVSGG